MDYQYLYIIIQKLDYHIFISLLSYVFAIWFTILNLLLVYYSQSSVLAATLLAWSYVVVIFYLMVWYVCKLRIYEIEYL